MQRSLEGVDGVTKVSVDFDKKTATCTVEEGVEGETLVKALPERYTAKVKG